MVMTTTNAIYAMDQTLALAREHSLDTLVSPMLPSSITYSHLEGMLKQIMQDQALGTPFPQDKANRWLGWLQCGVMSLSAFNYYICLAAQAPALPGILTLESFKEINRNNSSD